MKKVLATLAIVMLMFSSMAFATNARVDGLGVPAWMIQDDSLTASNPAQLVNYPNMVVLEDGNLTQGNANLALGDGVIGFAMTSNNPVVA